MAWRIRAHDWATTPLGAIGNWPPGLRTVVDLLLDGPVATILLWGPDHRQIYNDQWRALMGGKHPAALGLPTNDTFPEIADAMAPLYARVRRGEAVLLEDALLPIGRQAEVREAWWNVQYFPVRDEHGATAGIFCTVIETTAGVVARRKLATAAAAVRESEERHTFLLRLSDALRPLADPAGIIATASETLGRHLRVGRCGYGETDPTGTFLTVERDWTDGCMPSATGRHRMADFGAEMMATLLAGHNKVVSDTLPRATELGVAEAYKAAGDLRASIGIPLMKDGRLVAALFVQQSSPRQWSAEDVALAEDTAERIWAALERARTEAALYESEERFRGFAENSADVLWIADRTGTRLEYLSPAFDSTFGEGREHIMADLGRWADLVHPADRAQAMGYMSRALAGQVAIAHYRVVRPRDGQTVHLRDTGFPIRDAAGTVTRVAGIVQDVTDMVRAGEALEAEKERFRVLAEGIPQLVWRSRGDGSWTWASPQWVDYTGQCQQASHGRGWLDAVHPDDRAAAEAAWREAVPHGRLDVEYRVRRAADGAWRWHQTRSVPLRAASGQDGTEGPILEWLGTTTDIEDLKRLQGRQQVLVAELQHRTRNLLAVVRNIARRSIDASPGRDDYDARLAALGRVQGFLSRSTAYMVSLADVVEAELHTAADGIVGKVFMAGPAVELPGESVQAVALALHELATNAVKYGAIAQAAARLSVTWHLTGDNGEHGRRLVIDWRESGVAMPEQTSRRRGYGSELITKALPYQLQADTSLEFTPDGVHCRIALKSGRFSLGAGRVPA